MRSNRTSREQQAAVSARLAQLSNEFVAGRIRADSALESSGVDGGQAGEGVLGSEEADGSDGSEGADGWGDERVAGWGEDWSPPDTHTRIAARRWGADGLGGAGERPATGPEAEPGGEPVGEPAVDTPARTRIRPPLPVGEPDPAEDSDDAAARFAGRHARPRGGLGAGPWGVIGRIALGPAQLAVVTLTVVAALALTGWWLWRATPTEIADGGVVSTTQVAQPLVEGLAPPSAAAQAGEDEQAEVGTKGTADGEVVVDVAGKVRRPGIAVLDAGSRVVDALKMAGGARRDVDLTAINLARPLVDGEQILVGVKPATGVVAGALAAPPTGPTGPSGAAGAGEPTPLVPINTAGQAELETLPEVGPVTATAILSWREENGGFTSVDELLEVDGIGEVTLERLAPLVTL